MELKVVCHCGQKYKFDVEPVNQQMPFTVNCPICGVDGTSLANNLLLQLPVAAVPVAAPVAATAMAPAPATPGLRINRPPPPTHAAVPPVIEPAAGTTTAAPPPRGRPVPHMPAPATPKYMQNNPAIQNNNFFMGILGAVIGAIVAVGVMVGFTEFTGFRFPLLGTVMGAIIGFGARLLYRGTSSTLGGVSALISFVTITVTLFLMFGIAGLVFGVISVIIGTSMGFKIASG